MERLEWNDRFLTGIDLLDYQHKKLFELINLFFETLEMTKGPDLRRHILHGLLLYVKTHLADEEEAMQKMEYPERIEHIERHKTLFEQIETLARQWNSGRMAEQQQLCGFLKHWLIEHIGVEDKKIGTFYAPQKTPAVAGSGHEGAQ